MPGKSIFTRDLSPTFKKWREKVAIKKRIKFFKVVMVIIVIIASVFTIVEGVQFYWQLGPFAGYYDSEDYSDTGDIVGDDLSEAGATQEKEKCNVRGVEIKGHLATYISNDNIDSEGNIFSDQSSSESIARVIIDAEQDDSIKAILLEIDSAGGYPVAAEEVADRLKWAQKPTIALIRQQGLSAAYWAATGADAIFASKNSDVGSIGVTFSYLSNTAKNKKEGLEFIDISSGKFKDTGDPDKILTSEEKALLIRDTKIIHENFIEAVAKNRNLDIEKVRKLADGSSMLGQMALENGLIDKIGSGLEVKEYIEEKIGEKMDICW